jgi:tetratricopeptide (TPR) repeat protein
VVLDDVADPADLDGLWPAGPAGQVLVTTAAEGTVPAAHQPALFPVGAFSSHEALTYLMGRLSADPDHPGTLAARADLGGALLTAGQPFEAIVALEAVLAEAPGTEPADHGILDLSMLDVQDTLAAAYQAAGRNPDAIRLAARTLAEREKQQGPDHPDALGARGQLASAYHSAGRMASALELYERSWTDCRRVLGPSHPDTLAAQANLAHAYYAMGRQAEATRLLTGALADCERLLPAGDPLTDAIRDSLDAVARG